LHSGLLAGASIAGIQSNHIIATVKHFALNGQETARSYVDARIADSNARESDLLAFQIAIEKGQPGAVMCAYNKVNGAQACGNDYLLNQVLKRDWGYKGFVMSDWGAVHALDYALQGLDQQSGSNLDVRPFFGEELQKAASGNAIYKERLRDMNRRILRSIYAQGLDAFPVKPGGSFDSKANLDVAEAAAAEGLVLLKNDGVLPLQGTVRKIAVVGGYADTGVLSGAGSSQVHMQGGPAAIVSAGGTGPLSAMVSEQYQRSTPPLDAVRKRVPNAEVTFRNGFYITDAVQVARKADVAIVFANQWQTEGFDQPDLSLPRGQDALIEAVAAANPNTIVVLQTGGPIQMPWLGRVRGVIEAWYPGGRGGEVIAKALFGDINPSGRLPISFPASTQDLPRPVLDGSDTVEPQFQGQLGSEHPVFANYDIEGSNVGYRWYAARGLRTLFPFGFGLSYTRFSYSALHLDGLTARVSVTNAGHVPGATVPQVYMVSTPTGDRRRLVAFGKVFLQPGETREVTMQLEPRVIAQWEKGGWRIASGQYTFALGENAEKLGDTVHATLPARRWSP